MDVGFLGYIFPILSKFSVSHIRDCDKQSLILSVEKHKLECHLVTLAKLGHMESLALTLD